MEESAEGEKDDSFTATDNATESNNGEAQRQTTPSPRTEDKDENCDERLPSEVQEEHQRSSVTTPDMTLGDNADVEEGDGEQRSDAPPRSEPAAGSPIPASDKETGLAGSMPWPRDAPDDEGEAPPRDILEDEAAEETQNTSPRPREDGREIENDQHNQIELPSNEMAGGRIDVTASSAAPPLETSDGAPYTAGTYSRKPLPLTINKVAIENSARYKLPLAEVKGRMVRLGRHTEASSQKIKKWYKNDNYVDKDSYSWRNMPLFDDFQRHLYTSEGAARTSFKK